MSHISIEELRENFDFYDKDGDGRLSRDEFVGLIEFDEFARWFSGN